MIEERNCSTWINMNSRPFLAVNCFARMRYCTPDGRLNFSDNGPVGSQEKGYVPWYEVVGRKSSDLKIVFGHWSSLVGHTGHPNVFALDTGCLWGGGLTAMRLDHPPELYTVDCDKPCFDEP